MEKLYKKIGWKNKPNLATPLGATNLKKIDEALDGLDNRTIELNSKDAEQGRHIEGLYAEVRTIQEDVADNSLQIKVTTAHVDSLLKDIQGVAEDVNGLKIVNTASGTTAYMDDASNMGFEDIDFFGESKQMQTTGKNVCGELIEGKVIDYISGMAVSNTNYACTDFVRVQKGESFVIHYAFGSAENWFYDISKNPIKSIPATTDGNIKYFTADADGYIRCSLQIANKNLFMIEKGTVATEYEPYTNGPAPNPDYPQTIEPFSVDSVRVYRKNLLNPSGFTTMTSNGVTFTPVFKDGLLQYINVNGTATANVYYGLLETTNVPSQSRFINGCKGGSSNTFSILVTYRKEDNTFAKEAFQTDADLAIDTTQKKYNVNIFVRSGATVSNAKVYPMIRPSFFIDGTYEPYQSQTVNLSAPIELNGIGGVKDTDKLKKFGVIVFDGSADEGWYTMDTITAGVKRLYTRKFPAKYVANHSTIPNMLCSHYKPTTPSNTFNKVEGITISSKPSDIGNAYIYIYDERFNTADTSLWKAHLQANPITVVYELAEPIETALPKADADAIKALHTYKPNTVVMNDADAEMDVHYVADGKIYIDRKFETLASAIVNQ